MKKTVKSQTPRTRKSKPRRTPSANAPAPKPKLAQPPARRPGPFAQKPPARLPAGHVVTPGGHRHKSFVHIIRPGEAVTRAGGVMRKINLATQKVTDLPRSRARVPAPSAVGHISDQWIVYTSWLNRTKRPITTFSTTWTVPNPPQNNSGQLIYLFNGLLDKDKTCILQPVLQWGASGFGGNASWGIANWLVDSSGHVCTTDLVPVAVGDVVTGQITVLDQSNGSFDYLCQFKLNNGPGPSLPALDMGQLTLAVETLECYGITGCQDYPGTDSTAMRAIQVQSGANDLAVGWYQNDLVTDCGQHTTIVTDGSPNGEVDIFYRAPAPRPAAFV